MSDVITFRRKKIRMCPDDWKNPFNPTLYELRMTIDTVKECHADCLRQLSTAGVQSELILRDKLRHLEDVHSALLDYYVVD
jgi:hypothetical protein